MSVRLRLTRMGRKKRPYYRIVAVDSRRKRDGAYLERIGYYHPLDNPPRVEIDADAALKWLRNGAQPTDTVRSLLRREGVWYRFHLERLVSKGKLEEGKASRMLAEFLQRRSERQPAPAKADAKRTAVGQSEAPKETMEGQSS